MSKKKGNIQNKISTENTPLSNEKTAEKKKRTVSKVGTAIALVLVIAVAAVWAVSGFSFDFSDTPKKAVKRHFDALSNLNYTAYCETLIGNRLSDLQKEVSSYPDGNSYLRKYMEETYENFGDDAKISVSDMSVYYEKTKNDTFVGQNLKELNVSEVATVSCTIKISGSLSSASQEANIICFKSGGKWYVFSMAGEQPDQVQLDTNNIITSLPSNK